MKKSAEKITIVIIAHNDEKHIGTAVNSVINQTMKEISIICVDDGSTDRTPDIMCTYAARDARVQMIALEENRGQLYARYVGALAADSEYILFLDSDDTFAPDACEVLWREIQRRDCDVLQFGVNLITEPGTKPTKDTIEWLTNYFKNSYPIPSNITKPQLLHICFAEQKLTWNVWNKIYKLELVQQALKHYAGEKIVMCEDVLFSAMIYIFCRKVEKINDKLYNYSVGGGVSTDDEKLEIKSDADMEIRAGQFQVYSLLLKWLQEENYPVDTISYELEDIRNRIVPNILYTLLHRCIPKRRKEYLSHIARYWPKEDFINEYIGYVFDSWQADPVEALDALKGSEYTKIIRKEIKTVGMFYHRLANGGVERVMSLLASIWESAGYRVVVITEQKETPYDYDLPLDTKRVVLGEKFAANRARAKRFRQVIRDNHIDAMVYHAWLGSNFLQDAIVVKSEGIPLIVHTHSASDEPYGWAGGYQVAQHKAYSLADAVITLSEADRIWWKALGYKAVQVVNPSTYDLREIATAPLTSKNILCVSRLSEEKQFEDAFKIARLVQQKVPEAKLVFVGKSETEEQDEAIRQKLEQEGMSDYICMEGFHRNVRPYYRDASVFLSTSSIEGFGMTFIESKIFGLPMVAYDLTNIDALRNPEGAIVVPQRDAYGAAEAIVRLLQDDELRRELGRQARQSVEELYQEDLAVAWKNIFDLSLQPIEEKDKSPLETAIYRVVDTVFRRASSAGFGTLQYSGGVYAVTHSTAYRVGRLITYFPRQVKDFVIICKGRGFSAGIAFIKEKLRTIPQVIKRF